MKVLVIYQIRGVTRRAGAEMEELPAVGDILEGFGFKVPLVVADVRTVSRFGSGIRLTFPEVTCARWAGELAVKQPPPEPAA